MNADVVLSHAEQQFRKFDLQEEGKVVNLPAYVEKMQQAGLHA